MDREAWWATVPWGREESDTTEWLTLSLFSFFTISLREILLSAQIFIQGQERN